MKQEALQIITRQVQRRNMPLYMSVSVPAHDLIMKKRMLQLRDWTPQGRVKKGKGKAFPLQAWSGPES